MAADGIRILIIDDEPHIRTGLSKGLACEAESVDTATDGREGLARFEQVGHEIVITDVRLPGEVDGLEVVKQVKSKRPETLIIVITAYGTVETAVEAMRRGAFDFVTKPADAASVRMDEIAGELISRIKVAARSDVTQRPPRTLVEPARFANKPAHRPRKEPTKIVAVGISTGGPNALQYLLSELPSNFPGSIVVVQHMPEGFTEMFAQRLNECCAIDVKEAQSGDLLIAGRALICPGNRHMKVRRMPMGNIVVLSDEERVNGHRPSVDVLFRSVAAEFGSRAVGVLMTGMGDDGACGMGLLKQAGALTIAQSEESCVVYGMPKAAIERGNADRVVSLELMANTLNVQCNPERVAQTAHIQV